MEAYRQAFGAGGTMILSPDSDFFRYFNDPTGRAAPRSSRAKTVAFLSRRRCGSAATAPEDFRESAEKAEISAT